MVAFAKLVGRLDRRVAVLLAVVCWAFGRMGGVGSDRGAVTGEANA